MKITILITVLFITISACSGKKPTPLLKEVVPQWLSYEPSIFEIGGVIKKEQKYGPPNYGETPEQDKKVWIYVLTLDSPVNVKGDSKGNINSDSFESIKEIQLTGSVPLKNYENKTVTVKGSLFEAVTAHHYTKVLMTVLAISVR